MTRPRENPVIRVIETFELPSNSSILSDEMVYIGATQHRSENVFRKIKLLDDNRKELTLITNRIDLSADEIAYVYKSRWAIEFIQIDETTFKHQKILRS